jgi:hypothetical protein
MRIKLIGSMLLAISSAALAMQSDYSTKETRALTHTYAKCVVGRQAAKASEALLKNADNTMILRKYRSLVSSECLARNVPGGATMVFRGDLYRYALADAMVNRELATDPVPDLSAVPRLDQRPMPEHPQEVRPNGKKLSKRRYEAALEEYQKEASFGFLARYGECIVRLDTANSKALLLTSPDSPEEARRFTALRPALEHCLPDEWTLKFGRTALRGTIAINYYRLAHAAKAGRTDAAILREPPP